MVLYLQEPGRFHTRWSRASPWRWSRCCCGAEAGRRSFNDRDMPTQVVMCEGDVGGQKSVSMSRKRSLSQSFIHSFPVLPDRLLMLSTHAGPQQGRRRRRGDISGLHGGGWGRGGRSRAAGATDFPWAGVGAHPVRGFGGCMAFLHPRPRSHTEVMPGCGVSGEQNGRLADLASSTWPLLRMAHSVNNETVMIKEYPRAAILLPTVGRGT